MKLAVQKERHPAERRVATSPDAVKRLIALGFDVTVETGAGVDAGFPDQQFEEAGASIAADAAAAVAEAEVVLRVRPPGIGDADGDVGQFRAGTLLVGMLSPYHAHERLEAYARHGVSAFSMEFMPRITRAQGMDVLSSQSNLSGYAAVIRAAAKFGRAFPMMVTAAGTVAPARILVLGAGVAGLQAIATAKRLGGVVSAMDVRPAAREQVESLGATFVDIDSDESRVAETKAGYAREMSASYLRQQAEKLSETLVRTDIAITTALIPGRPAPVLISAEMVARMRPGSVIVDLAVEQGGNCVVSEPGRTVDVGGVHVIGDADLPSAVATDASSLYARNLVNFLGLLVDADTKALKTVWDDEILKSTLITHDGRIVHPVLLEKGD